MGSNYEQNKELVAFLRDSEGKASLTGRPSSPVAPTAPYSIKRNSLANLNSLTLKLPERRS